MAVNRFQGSFKTRSDILDNITPNNVVQSNVSAPAGEWKPCAWLPVIWRGDASKDSFVISSGKIVSMTSEGRICPARYRWLAENAAKGDVAITYTQLDVDHGTIDVRTGERLTAVPAAAITCFDLAKALVQRGLAVAPAAVNLAADNGDIDAADVQGILQDFVSPPVGVCAYDVYAWAGDAPGELNHVNYQKQHLVQFLTDVQLQVPAHVEHAADGSIDKEEAAENDFVDWVPAANGDGDEFPRPAAPAVKLTAAQLAGLARYAGRVSANDTLSGLALKSAPIASNTARTPISDGETALVRQKSSIAKISKAGDFFVDADVGIIIAHGVGAFTADVSYYRYGSAAASSERYVHLAGFPRPGAHVTYDAQSNFALVDVTAATVASSIVGRCLGAVRQPRGLLGRVRTAFDGASFDKTAQMPGSATAGFTDLITLSDEGTSDLVALINIKVQ